MKAESLIRIAAEILFPAKKSIFFYKYVYDILYVHKEYIVVYRMIYILKGPVNNASYYQNQYEK